MIVFEFKIPAKKHQLTAIDEAIRIGQFVRNKCLRFWLDNKGIKLLELNKYCAVLAKKFKFANKLNSMARQAAAERAADAIKRFYDNCQAKVPGKKGFPIG
jgi:putative transposase